MDSVAAAINQAKQENVIIHNDCPALQEHKGQPCCDHAKRWLVGMGRSYDFNVSDRIFLSDPAWLKYHYEWGPSPWPLYWCEAVERKVVDCGVLRIFATTIFRAKGIEAFPAQVLRFQQSSSTQHWQKRWQAMPTSFPWAAKEFVYHEICAVKDDAGHCRLYDPTDGIWLDRDIVVGHNGHFAVRVETPEILLWNDLKLGGYQWTAL